MLLVVVTLVAMLFGLWILPAEEQRATVAAIQARGGQVGYSVSLFGRNTDQWLAAWIPIDYFARPFGVSHAQATDVDLSLICRLRTLELLAFSGDEVTDIGISQVAQLQSLERLEFDSLRVTSEGLRQIGPLPRLRELMIRMGVFRTGNGLDMIREFPELLELGIASPLHDSELVHVPPHPKLQTLKLVRTQITGPGLAVVRGLPALRYLILRSSPVTDEGLKHLRGHPALEYLDLSGTRITYEGTASLGDLPRLRDLNLDSTGVDGRGLIPFRENASLRELSLRSIDLRDADLSPLATMPQLNRLYLSSSINDRTLAGLAGSRALQKIDLESAGQITGEGLLHLAAIPSLQEASIPERLEYGYGATVLRNQLPSGGLITSGDRVVFPIWSSRWPRDSPVPPSPDDPVESP